MDTRHARRHLEDLADITKTAPVMRLAFLVLATLLCLSSVGLADGIRVLKWDDLLPRMEPLADPFKKLSEEQQGDMGWLAEMVRMKAQGIELDTEEGDAEKELRDKLSADGVDVEDLLRQDKEYLRELARRNALVVEALDGEDVRIPGYALPLEFSGAAVSEFLLVPYVGACIHVPPPPPNQIVYVRAKEPYAPKDLFDPVWVNGRLSVAKTRKELSLVDGAADINAGYAVNSGVLEPYER